MVNKPLDKTLGKMAKCFPKANCVYTKSRYV